MDRLKDFLYDKNDIIITLVILLIAGLLIAWRMDAIMKYPAALVKEIHTAESTKEPVTPPVTKPPADPVQKPEPEPPEPHGALWENGTLASDIFVTIHRGSAVQAVNTLIAAGLFTSYEEYTEICRTAGYDPLGIKAASFTFPRGFTKKEIAHKVTQ